ELERLEELGDRHLARLVEDQAERALVVVLDHEDHGPVEGRVDELGHGQEEPRRDADLLHGAYDHLRQSFRWVRGCKGRLRPGPGQVRWPPRSRSAGAGDAADERRGPGSWAQARRTSTRPALG